VPARLDGVAEDMNIVQAVVDENLAVAFARAVRADTVPLDDHPVAAARMARTEHDPLDLVADDSVAANQVVGIPLSDGDARRAVALQAVVQAVGVRGAQAVVEAEVPVV